MLTDEDIKKQGYEAVASNLYVKDGEMYVQQSGEMKLASTLTEEQLDMITDIEAYRKLSKKKEEKKPKKDDKPMEKKTEAIVITKEEYMRGTQEKVVRLMDEKLQLDSIIEASKDPQKKPGEGVLWHELIFKKKNKKGDWIEETHQEPSVELVDMIVQDMGHITTKILEFGTNTLEDPNTHEKYLTYYCVVEAQDLLTKITGLGAAEQIIDFNEIKNNGRTFARTNAIRKAERNAKERMIPIPRKALVAFVIKKLEKHQKEHKGKPQ